MELTATFIKNVKHTGKPTGDKHHDGEGLYLLVKAAGKYWRMDYTRPSGKRNTLAIGVYPAVSLADAREARAEARKLLAQGIDPSTAKRTAKREAKQAAATTYEAVAREFHAMKAPGWSEAHAGKWLRMNELYLFPAIGRIPVSELEVGPLLAALRKVEERGTLSTAQDLQQMAGQVLRYALQTGRIKVNPAPDLRGALKPHVPKNFAAVLEPSKASELLRAIDGYTGQPTTTAALQLAALIFQRPGNVRAMQWAWIDMDSAMLTIPAENMKRTVHGKVNGRPHLIPLATQALAILQSLQPLTGHGRYVFPSNRTSERPMSDGTMNAALRRLDFGTDDHVSHGFRAMARTMLAERIKGINPEVVEAQLGHGKSGPLGSAYDRAEFMEQRRTMMQTWADYLDQLRQGAQVIQLRA